VNVSYFQLLADVSHFTIFCFALLGSGAPGDRHTLCAAQSIGDRVAGMVSSKLNIADSIEIAIEGNLWGKPAGRRCPDRAPVP
jgi:hypothetical protein